MFDMSQSKQVEHSSHSFEKNDVSNFVSKPFMYVVNHSYNADKRES